MHVQVLGHRALDQVQEPPELLGPMPRGHVGDHLPRGHVQRGVEVGGAVAHVVVGGRSGTPGMSGNTGARAVERLDLGLLIDAQHHGGLGRIQVEPDDIADLVDELRVGDSLKRLGLVRL